MEAPSAVLRRLFERYAQAGVEGALEVLAEDAVFVVSPGTSTEPDVYEGHEGAHRYFAGFEGAIDDVQFELTDARDESPEAALAEVRLSGRGATSEIPVELTDYMSVTVRDGTIARLVSHPDIASAREAIARERDWSE